MSPSCNNAPAMLMKDAQGPRDQGHLGSGAALLQIVAVHVLDVTDHHLIDGGRVIDLLVRPDRRGRDPVGQPFAHEAAILGVALGAVVLAEVMVVPVDADDGQIPGLVVAVLGEWLRGCRGGHGGRPFVPAEHRM
jgi:hypothetical protein